MYLSSISISGYKIFDDKFTATFNPGLNIILGENGSGKSAIINAIRLIKLEDEYGRGGIDYSDFHRKINLPSKSKGLDSIQIMVTG